MQPNKEIIFKNPASSGFWFHYSSRENQRSNQGCFICLFYVSLPIPFGLPGAWDTWACPGKMWVNQSLLTVYTKRADFYTLTVRKILVKSFCEVRMPFTDRAASSCQDLSFGMLPPGESVWRRCQECGGKRTGQRRVLFMMRMISQGSGWLIHRFGFSQVRLLFKEGVKPTTSV